MAIFPTLFFQAIKARKMSFTIFCLYVILTNSYLRRQTIETSSLPTDSSRPQFEQIEIFSSILTVYLNCKYCPLIYARVTRVPPRDFASGRNPCRENGHFSNFIFLGNKGQENVFYHILERKIAFLGYRNKNFKKSKH